MADTGLQGKWQPLLRVPYIAPSVKPRPTSVRVLWILTLFLVLIGVAVVIRRMVLILAPPPAQPRFPEAVELDAGFTRHPVLTMVHIIPGLLFMLLAPLQFVRRLRTRQPKLHRVIGRIVLISGMVIGGTALVMSPQMAIGGANETAATMLFAIIFLFCLLKGFMSIRQKNVAVHREWMIRAFAIGLAVATIRPIVGAFFATRMITHLALHDFFGTAFWLGFTIQLMAAEVWINYTRPRMEAKRRA